MESPRKRKIRDGNVKGDKKRRNKKKVNHERKHKAKIN